MMLAVPGMLAGGVATALAADPVIAAVGDLGCAPNDPSYNNGAGTATDCRQRYISDLAVAANPNALLLMGDTQYQRGELANFNAVFDPTFGRLNSVVYPVPGNVEYDDGFTNAPGYFTYFARSGVRDRIAATSYGGNVDKGYYSFDVGNWHIVGLNSNCSFGGVGGCGPGSPQANWLKADLAANRSGKCVLAFAHHARWNSGTVADDTNLSTFWNELYGVRADVFLSGHANHHYERHAPQGPSGNPDSAGIRQFIVSTGGEHHGTAPGSPGNTDTLQVANYTRFGILKLTLHPTSYDWEFVQDAGTTPPPSDAPFTDSGTGNCNAAVDPAPPADPTPSADPSPPADPSAPGAPQTGAATSAANRGATELNVARLRIARRSRTLELNGSVTSQATGNVDMTLSSPGRTTKLSAPIRNHGFSLRSKIPAAQARLGSGLVTVRYAGDDRTRPLTVRLRAATASARLNVRRPTIANGRLKASGTITSRARGVVRVRLELVRDGAFKTLVFTARISNGRWKLDHKLSSSAMTLIQQRSGTVHSYSIYAGSRSRGISGGLRSFKVLGDR